MATRAENEGFRVLDDFTCDAIHEPGIPRADPTKQGKNIGVRVTEELVFGGEGDRQPEDNQTGIKGLRGFLSSLMHFPRPDESAAVPRLTWEHLKEVCAEGSPDDRILVGLCDTVRSQELALWESYRRLTKDQGKLAGLDRVRRAVRRQAVAPNRTYLLVEAVKAELRELVREVDSQPDPGAVVKKLALPEDIVRIVAREKFAAQMLEIMEELLIEQSP